MVFEIGKFLLSTMRALPPLPTSAGVSSMWCVYWCLDFLNATGVSSSMLLGMEPGTCVSAHYFTGIAGLSRLTSENVLVLLVDVFEDLRWQAEVLCHHRFGRVLDPFVQKEGAVLGEITTVEDQQELGSVLA
jgi:hypothetical protein